MNLVMQLTEEIKKELPNTDVDEIAEYLANFNTVFVKTALEKNPVYIPAMYNMLDNLITKLTHWKINPFIIQVLYKSYVKMINENTEIN